MIVDHKRFDLFEKMAFEKAIVVPPVTMPAMMPNEACFFYVINGVQQAVGPVETATLKKEDGVLLKCGNFYAKMLEPGADGKLEAIAIHFYPEVLKKVYESGLPQFLKQDKASLPGTNMAIVRGDKMIHKYIESLIFYFQNPDLANEELLILKLKELILLLSQTEYAPKVHDILSHLFSPQSFELTEIVAANIFNDLSIEQLANLCARSLSSFKREFKALYNTSPASYIRKKRLEKAADLLLGTSLSISDIAFDCSFNDLAHFSKCFKKQYHKSPQQFRLDQMNKSLN